MVKDAIDTIRFNFHYLPFKQAVRLPIYIHNAHFVNLRGKVTIAASPISRGMIVMGVYGVPVFPNTGFAWDCRGQVVFKGRCQIGAGSGISVNSRASIVFGDDFLNSHGLTLIASRRIEFGRGTRLGWHTMVLDTNMHPLKNRLTNKKSAGGAPICIGDYNWFSTNSVILPGVKTPERIICGLGSVVPRNIQWEPWCLYGGSPLRKLKENIYRDYQDDKDEAVFGPVK